MPKSIITGYRKYNKLFNFRAVPGCGLSVKISHLDEMEAKGEQCNKIKNFLKNLIPPGSEQNLIPPPGGTDSESRYVLFIYILHVL